MKIEIHLEENDRCTPLAFATELIRMGTENNSPRGFDKYMEWLAEIAEYLITYTKYNRREQK